MLLRNYGFCRLCFRVSECFSTDPIRIVPKFSEYMTLCLSSGVHGRSLRVMSKSLHELERCSVLDFLALFEVLQ